MKNLKIWLVFTLLSIQLSVSQTILEANGKGDTYQLINSVFSPGYDGIEAPDCAHPDFGKHIDEVFDKTLDKYVFRFHIHTKPDNDRCKNFDRQRNEIKTFESSPDNLKGIVNENVVYKWKFKLDANFQPSSGFTHIHQLKAVGGSEEGMPLITLTPRKGKNDVLEIRYAANVTQTTIKSIDLSLLKGVWVEVVETVTYGETGVGKYAITISTVDKGKVLLNYSNNNIRMWKTDAKFMRPKWGIYRSLKDISSLRDEQLMFADFSIQEF
jgi:hypothetical protein